MNINKQLTITEMQTLAQKRGGLCLSDTYLNAHSVLVWECAKGHRWKATPNHIQQGRWCPRCAGKNKTIEDMHQIAHERGGKCLSEKYLGVKSKLLWECSEGHSWEATPDKVIRGRWCPECSTGLGERICRVIFGAIFCDSFPKRYPDWLVNKNGNRMELDGYCKNLGVAFEHQGEQHFSTRTLFVRSQKALIRRSEDDQLKRQLCKDHKIQLIEIPEIGTRLPIDKAKQYVIQECKVRGIDIPPDMAQREISFKKAYATSGSKEALDKLRGIAKLKGGQLLSDSYISARANLLWECQEGHRWQTPAYNIIDGTWCPVCGGTQKLTIEDMRHLARKKGGNCLSRKYINGKTKLLWECAKGHQWKAIPNNVKEHGRWCPYCGGSLKLTIEEMRKIAMERGGKCLSNEYINNRSKLLWECKECHQWEAIPNSIKRGTWCPKCNKKEKLTIEEMGQLAKKKGGTYLSKIYVDSGSKLLWKCYYGHEWEASPEKVKAGTWCPICYKERGRIKQ